MISSNSGRRRSFAVSAAAALLILTGCGTGTGSEDAQAPTTTAAPATSVPATLAPSASPETSPSAEPSQTPALPPVLEASKPVSFSIPTIEAGSELLSLGLRENGSLEVPPDGPGAPASWYNQSPTPGERGPAVLLGHVNATGGGPGVFADLRALKAGDLIEVKREDGSIATFAVTKGEQYPKDDFPTQKVYGNTEGAELRLITCDGYDPETGLFDDNYVVYAELVI
ncbi:peptidase C60 sortase A and B [Arthrobacter sp. Soil782]|uniref:class F sortase n=1 Tax=Arthrobacter sp. Soil782 TaxID=1736410 RepID=UPI0006F5970C|nr:class F sortase [Arthrobacter sp. Soil782]KRF05179.1 peptidase C60 sortase A and B [Arthrobacter sp. Soil782]